MEGSMSIAKRVGAIVAGVLCVTLLIIFGVLRTTEESHSLATIEDQIAQQKVLLVRSITFAMGQGVTDVQPFISTVSKSKNLRDLRILPTNLIKAGGEDSMDVVEKKILSSKEPVFVRETYHGEPVVRALEPVLADEGCITCHSAAVGVPLATVSMRYSLSEYQAGVAYVRWLTVGLALAAILVIFFGVMFMVRRQVLNDLGVVVQHLEILSEGDVSKPLAIKRTDEIGVLSTSVNRMQESLRGKTEAALEMARGNLSVEVPLLSDRDELGKAIKKAIAALQSLIEETRMLTSAAVQGNLSARGNAANFEGGYRQIVHGVNETLDAVITPLNVAAEYVRQISKGDIPEKITDEYFGDFNTIKDNLNICVDAVRRLVNDSRALSAAAVDGRLSERADASKHHGDFRAIVEGVNATLDSLMRPVEDSASVLKMMAEGDLTARVHGEYRGDHRKIVESINTVASSLEKALRDVSEAVSATASASSQISSSTEQMAAGAQEQTSQAGDVVSAVEEMTKTIAENSQNAGVAADTAKKAQTNAHEGGRIVGEAIEGMKRISNAVRMTADTVRELGRSSDQIGEIINVIDDIADQTNLLALNAAIEAARAGEQGRGFSVVADEVRKLAERTTRATKEIAGTIKKIQSDTTGAVKSMEEGTGEVERGIVLADRAGASLHGIVDVIQEVTDKISQIAAASEEQSSASEEIAKNVEAISKVTGETAQGTQQIARAAEDLNRLTDNLEQLVSRFAVGGSSHGVNRKQHHHRQALEA
jgi:methyl-accepting chemotaxis protein